MKNPRYPVPRRVLLTLDQKALCTLSSAFLLQFVVAWATALLPPIYRKSKANMR